MTVSPPGTNPASYTTTPSKSVTITGDYNGQGGFTACNYFPSARDAAPQPDLCKRPVGAEISLVSKHRVRIVLSPASTKTPYTTRSFLLWYSDYANTAEGAGCRLPDAQRSLCGAILAEALKRLQQPLPALAAANALTTTTTSSSEPAVTGLLANASNGVLFIQWTRTSGTVRGTLSEAYTPQGSATQVSTESHSFTGVVSGKSVTLTLDDSTNWNGALDGKNVTLSFTSSDGTVQSFTFMPASASDYNAGVAALRSGASAAQGAQQQAAQDQQNRQALDTDVSQVQTDLGDLTSAVSTAKADVGTIASDVGTMRSDVQTTNTDLQTLLSDSKDSQCGDQGTVDSDASGTVASDLSGTLTSDRDGTLASDLGQVTSAITTLQADFKKYRDDQAVVTNYTPPQPPTQAQINGAVATARAGVASIHASVARYFATANKLLAQANGYAAQADAACKKAGG